MRYVIFVLLVASVASLHEQSKSVHSENFKLNSFPSKNQMFSDHNLTKTTDGNVMIRTKRSNRKTSLREAMKLERRKAKQHKMNRYLRKELRKAERNALLQQNGMLDAKRQSREDDVMTSHEVTQERQNELLATVDDLPKRATTVEISVKDPGMCKVDGVTMCKHGGECMSRDEGGAPVFFCACQPAWGGDFCHERRDPCSAGLLDCGSMFRCRRDERNRLAGFTCDCHRRLGWARRSESDPRCIRITNCSEGNPCQNGGTCHQEEGGFVCVCSERSSGDLCEHVLPTAAEVAGPAVSRIEALLQRSGQPADTVPQRRDVDETPPPGADRSAGYHSMVSANYAVPPPKEDTGADLWADDSGAAPTEDLAPPDPGDYGSVIDMNRVSARYGGIVSAKYGVPPAESDYNSFLRRRAADVASAGWPVYGYYNSPWASQSGAAAAGHYRNPWEGYGATASRRRRSHDRRGRRTSARRRQHERFLERLLRDVEPQIRRTARDSVIELPRR
ncbi:Fat-like cadherin-related tumor suppressor [Amphibalanus amphitrite]|uniref:Fat-like cadherin-related tumor suppressor n=1 Tax=Amphibalanus amphitrite TaxID=1232801 RepID=A0A6A4X774_AMPAM|nr:Fat-like cadherin-related tumor suppressor [Amphibalanus amphitrite]